jgi:hypothetical protein
MDSNIRVIANTSCSRYRQFEDHEDKKDQDKTPRPGNEHWRFSPNILDSSSLAFSSFMNQHSGFYTPTAGGMSMAYHNQAGDLHTPNMGFQLGTPLSMPTSDGQILSAATADMHPFSSQLIASHHYPVPHLFVPQQSYAPSSFLHQDSGFEAMDASHDDVTAHEMKIETGLRRDSSLVPIQMGDFEANMAAPPKRSLEKFVPIVSRSPSNTIANGEKIRLRYQVTLSAPTAMIRHQDEIPVTYLNKGQAYAMTIVDDMGPLPSPVPVKYRTVVRISFEDEEQRQRPSACWQLWKEGRGLAEAHFRGGRLQAVEYVDPNQGGEDEGKRPRVELESASFDCFAVTWSPRPGPSPAECSVAVRFNFLSTDFSHSKGVKGIPVRLCAKTEIISPGTPDSPPGPIAEVCFCKVKLFRDHGAERKLSNDVAHIKKTIDKLKQQIVQVEVGTNEYGKRKRSGSTVSKHPSHRPSKIAKHKRAWSISSQGSTGRPVAEDDLHHKLANIQAMFTSTRPVSVLYLKGYEQDDPDLYPVSLPGETRDLMKTGPLGRKASWDQKPSTETTPTNSCILSPSLSPHSMQSQLPVPERADFPVSTTFDANLQPTGAWDHFAPFDGSAFEPLSVQARSEECGSIKIQRNQPAGSLPEWIEALGTDPHYKPPAERLIKPVACFYVLIKVPGSSTGHEYYRSVYLMARTAKDLVAGIAAKCEIDPARIQRTLRINPKGLKIMVEDDTVWELLEGQDMTVEFSSMESDADVTTAGAMSLANEGADGAHSTAALEMRLFF